MNGLPDFCTASANIQPSLVPMICFHIVEWHQPYRVMHQFGLLLKLTGIATEIFQSLKLKIRDRFSDR